LSGKNLRAGKGPAGGATGRSVPRRDVDFKTLRELITGEEGGNWRKLGRA